MDARDLDAAAALIDRAEIEKLAWLYAMGSDTNARYFDGCLDENVEVLCPFGSWKGLEEYKRIRDAVIGRAFNFSRLLVSNPKIEIDGNEARGEYDVFSSQGLTTARGHRLIYSSSVFVQHLVRTAAGWRIKRHECRMIWSDGEDELRQAVRSLLDQPRITG